MSQLEICGSLKCLNPSHHSYYENMSQNHSKNELFFPLELLLSSFFLMTHLSIQSPQTGTKKQQEYLTVREWKTSCRDVREWSPQIPPLIMHPPCSHRASMPCLCKLTTSSLQQSQQTCMGTYLSKIGDSSYPQTRVSGATHIKGLRQVVNWTHFM